MSSDSSIHGPSLGSLVSMDDPGASRILSAPGTSPPPEAAAAIGPKSILHAVRRRWKLAMPIGLLLSALLGVAGWFLLAPKYTADAYLRLSADEQRLLFSTADQAKIDFKLYKNTQAQLMKNPFVLNAALRNEKVAALNDIKDQQDPLNFLQKTISVTFPGDSELMQVSYSSIDPDNAIAIVNAIVDSYKSGVVDNERKIRLERRTKLESVYAEAEENWRKKRNELISLAESLGTNDTESLSVSQQSTLQQFGQMQQKLSEIQFELMQTEGQLEIANKIAEQLASSNQRSPEDEVNEEEAAINALVERSPDVVSLRNEVDSLQGKMLSISQTYGTGFPAYKQSKQELEYKQQLLSQRRESARKDAMESLKKANSELEQRRANGMDSQLNTRTFDAISLEARAKVLKIQETMLKDKVDELFEKTAKLGRSSIEIEMLRPEIESLEKVLKDVGDELHKTSIELKTESRIQVMSPAMTATRPDVSKRITRSAALSLFGLFAPLMLLVGWDLTHRRVDSTDSVSDAISVPSLGAVPKVSERILFRDPPRGHRLEQDRMRLVEAIDSIGSMIQFLSRSEGSKVFLITSAIPNEGKSTVACQLAMSLSRSGNRVALVDLDLRQPSIHRYLKLENDAGACEVFEGAVELDDALQHFDNDQLFVLTAGSGRQTMQSLCTNGSVERLIDQLRSNYDVVIVDSCPVLPVADTRSLVKYCDSVVITLVRDLSRLPLVTQACSVLRSYRAQIIGGVMIGANAIGYGKQYYSRPKNQRAIDADATAIDEESVVDAN